MKDLEEGYTRESEDIPEVGEAEEQSRIVTKERILCIKERREGVFYLQTQPPKDRRTWAFSDCIRYASFISICLLLFV